MWHMSVPWWEFVIRAVVVYFFVLAVLRITGKRQVGQLAPFDLVLLLILANTVQNSMNAGDNSLVGGLISAASIVSLNYFIGFLAFKSKTVEAIIEGRPQILIHNGDLFDDVLKGEKLSRHELMAALRGAGCDNIEDVHVAVLENNGRISVTPRERRS
jgi:uncharacterized membrane protein YcaP (DUF421 family)